VKISLFSALICGASAVLSAGIIDSNTQSFDFSATGGPLNPTPTGTLTRLLNQFDPSLGTLTGVELFVTYDSLTMNIAAQVPVSQGPQASISGDFDLFAGLALPGFQANQTDFLTHFGCTPSGTEFVSCSNTQTFSQNDSVFQFTGPLPLLSDYIGPNTVVVTLQSPAFILNPVDTASTELFFNSTEVTGNVFLQYTFTDAASVPEPGSLALICTPLGLLWLQRFGKRAKLISLLKTLRVRAFIYSGAPVGGRLANRVRVIGGLSIQERRRRQETPGALDTPDSCRK
jgi:hypothetical protein